MTGSYRLFVALGPAALVLATPAFAAPREAPPAPVATGVAPAATAKSQRYCIKAEMTGSRVLRTVCKSRGEWENEGYDVSKWK